MTRKKKHKVISIIFYGGVGVSSIVIGILGLLTMNPEPVNAALVGAGMGIVGIGGIVATVSLLRKPSTTQK